MFALAYIYIYIHIYIYIYTYVYIYIRYKLILLLQSKLGHAEVMCFIGWISESKRIPIIQE